MQTANDGFLASSSFVEQAQLGIGRSCALDKSESPRQSVAVAHGLVKVVFSVNSFLRLSISWASCGSTLSVKGKRYVRKVHSRERVGGADTKRRTAVSAAFVSCLSRYSRDHFLPLREGHFSARTAFCPGHFVLAGSQYSRTKVYRLVDLDIRFILPPAHALTDNSTNAAALNVNLLAFILRLSFVVLMAGTSQSSPPALTMRCRGAHFVTDNSNS